MISLTKGEPKAIIKGGKYNNKILYINDPNKKCCEKCNDDCVFDPCCDECEGGSCGKCIENDVFDMVDEDYFRSLKKKMTNEDIAILMKSFKAGALQEDEDLYEIFQKTQQKNKEMSEKEFKIWDNGAVSPLPDFKKTFRYYIAGPAGSGKSYYCGQLLKTMRKVCPEKKIYIFSDVDEDKELDSIGNIIRFKLDEKLVGKKPIDVNLFASSVCVFDDIDSIQNPKLLDVVQKLRDALLRRGRHINGGTEEETGVSVIVTAHLMTNYKDTRIILNECNAITFFPKSGATNAIKYVLKTYVSMSKPDIDRVFELPSRWVTVFKNADPRQFVIYEKGMYLL